MEIRSLRRRLLAWFVRKGRSYPWRRTRDPYSVLVAELMLRRTRADQVLPVYRRFLAEFPTLKALSSARLRDLRRILSPLGLVWRTQNFVALSRLARHRGLHQLPAYDGLLELPGVGPYVANAVECFARRKPLPVVDTNVVRVLGRYFGCVARGEMRRNRGFIDFAQQCLDRISPREYNWALLDLGATVCTSTRPRCPLCPLRVGCTYAASLR
jgi:A/G-specific adenine glycosylase